MAKSGNQSQQIYTCYVCLQETRNSHEHHVYMQARTGELGPLVRLCGSCHTSIHAVASARAAKLRGGKPNVNNLEWGWCRHPNEPERAEQLIAPLVKIVLMTADVDLPVVTSLQLPVAINNGLKKLQADLGLKTKSATILHCVATVLHNKGLLQQSRTQKLRGRQ